MFDRADAVGDRAEVALTERLLVLHAERAVVGGDHLDVVRAQCLPHVVLVALVLRAQRRRAHPLRALERAPLLARGPQLVLEREVEVLRARLAEHVLSVVAGPGELLHGLLRAHVHDVERGSGEVRQHDRAVRRLLLHLPRAGDAVEVGGGLALRDELLGEHVDDGSVLGVHHRQQPRVRGHLHRAEDLRVVGVEDARVRHEHLEARDALVDEAGQGREGVGIHASDDLVEAVVDRAVARGELVPVREAVLDALAGALHGEVDDGRRAAPRGRAGAGLERVGGARPAEGELHVRVRVDPAGDDVLPGRVDDGVDGCREVVAQQSGPGREHGDDRLAVDEDVGGGAPGRRDDRAAGEESRGHLTPPRSRRTCRADGRGRTASRRASAARGPCRGRGSGSPRARTSPRRRRGCRAGR